MKLRWGILGVAHINERLIPGFKHARNAELCAIASRSLDKAQAAAKAAGIPVAHGSYEALLDDPKIDAVYIPLPNHLHAEWTHKAAEHGKHVLCEKPLCPTADDVRALVEFCKAKGVRIMDGFMWPHHPRTQVIRDLIDDGKIGEVIHVNAAFSFELDLTPENIRLKPETAGGSLLDVGCYCIYGIRWAMDAEPDSVWATATMQNGVDLRMTGVLKFGGGRTGSFDCGFTLPFRGWMEIVGTTGTIGVPDMWLPPERATYDFGRDDRRIETHVITGHNQIALMIEHFGEAVFEKRDAFPSPEEAVRTLRVLDALAKSAREDREVGVKHE
jgi:xylose dehydrogenase (NAD/NADP)